MDENNLPPAPPAGQDTSALAPPAPSVPPLQPSAPPAPADDTHPAEPEALLPTIREHGERKQLAKWQLDAVIARLHGAHDEDGQRVFEHGASLTTRMTDADFDQAVDVALHGRI